MTLVQKSMAAGCFALLAAGLLAACSSADDMTEGAGGGSAIVTCGPGAELCDGVCVDTSFDPAHCGGCGEVCEAGYLCSEGSCALECTGSTTQCGDRCVDTENDPAHCGECDNACDGGAVCVAGGCVSVCKPGESICGSDGCVDVSANANACGSCDTACGEGEICLDSKCTEPPLFAVSGRSSIVDGLFVIDTDDGEVTKIASLKRPLLSAVFKGGQLYGVEPNGEVWRVNHTTGATTFAASVAADGPRDLALLPDGRLLTCREGDHSFVGFDVETGAVSGIGGGEAAPQCEHGLGFGSDRDGTLFVAADDTLYTFDPDALVVEEVAPLSEPGVYKGLTFHQGDLYAVRLVPWEGGNIGDETWLVKIDPKTGKVDDVAVLPISVEGLASAAP